MRCQLPMPADADPEEFPHHEDFYTSLIACGILKARSQTKPFANLKIWWREKTERDEADGDWSEFVAPDLEVRVLQKWQMAGLAPDLRIESCNGLALEETKVDAELDEKQLKPVFRFLAGLGDARERAYLLMAAGGYGGPNFHPGTISKFYGAAKGGVRAGFVNLALATNWACELLGLKDLG